MLISWAHGRRLPDRSGSGVRVAVGSGASVRNGSDRANGGNGQPDPAARRTGGSPRHGQEWALPRKGQPRLILRAAAACEPARIRRTHSASYRPTFFRAARRLETGAGTKNSVALEPVCPRNAGRACLPPVFRWRCCFDCAVADSIVVSRGAHELLASKPRQYSNAAHTRQTLGRGAEQGGRASRRF